MTYPIDIIFRTLVAAAAAELGYVTRAEVEALVSQRLKELQSTTFRDGDVEWQGSNSGSWSPSVTTTSFVDSYAAMEANVTERVAEMQADEAPALLSSPGREKFREIARNDVETFQNSLGSIIFEKGYNTGARGVALEVASEDEFGLRFYTVIEAALADADNCIRQDATQALDRVRQHSIAYKKPNGSRLWAETRLIFARLRLDSCVAVSLSAYDALDSMWAEEREVNDNSAPPTVEVTVAQLMEAPSAPTANRPLSRAEVAKSRHLRKPAKVTKPASAETLNPVDVDIDLDESL